MTQSLSKSRKTLVKKQARTTSEAGYVIKTHGKAIGGTQQKKHENTTIGALRAVYGEDFAKGFRGDAKLGTVIETASKAAVARFLSTNDAPKRGVSKLSKKSLNALANATVELGPALKRLADK